MEIKILEERDGKALVQITKRIPRDIHGNPVFLPFYVDDMFKKEEIKE